MKIKAENIIASASKVSGEFIFRGEKINLQKWIDDIEEKIFNLKVSAKNVVTSKKIQADGKPIFVGYDKNLTNELEEIYKRLNNIENSLFDLSSYYLKSIELVLQELKLDPDEWEYKTENKLVRVKKLNKTRKKD